MSDISDIVGDFEKQVVRLEGVSALVITLREYIDTGPSLINGEAMYPLEMEIETCVKNLKSILERLRMLTSKAKLITSGNYAGNWLVTIRKERGLSQKYVAEQVRIAQPSYCTIEKGKTRPAVETAKAIASILGFDWTRFYDEKEES